MSAGLAVCPVTTEAEWAAARAIRHRVFVEEQACPPELEWDEHDTPAARGLGGHPPTCHHVLGWVAGEPVATARWRPYVFDGAPAAKLERFAVLGPWRGEGWGRALVAHVLRAARAAGYDRFVLHAQAHLRGFYEGLGFQPVGAPFEEVGIPHLKMALTPAPAGEAPVS